jgi:membrane protease YdiL (CAAX protease family)
MSGQAAVTRVHSLRRKGELIAAGCFVCWCLCAALARFVGIWYADGGAGILLGITVLVVQRDSVFVRTRFRPDLVRAGIIAGTVMTVATYVLYPFVGHFIPAVVPQAAALYATLGQAEPWRAALVLPLVITGEELVWRGSIQGALERRFGSRGAAAIGTLAYGIAVAPIGSPLLVAIALGCGIYWSALRAHYRSVTPALISHLIWGALVFLIAPLS